MTREEATAAAAKLGLALPPETWERLDLHVEALRKWQPAINLVANSTLGDIWGRHILDSLQVLPLIPPDARTLVDLGSGAGFPGLTLAIVRPDLSVRLVESDVRKSAFLGDVARRAAPNASILNQRIEATGTNAADIVTARALAPLPKLLDWAHQFVTDPTICLFHKGKGLDAELTDAERSWMMDIDRVPSVTAPDAAILRIARLRSRR
ncbi:16S rRNA (guanine(527)-N(7))-methyltransferase RsmG [Reyranella sp. CPCC 100927]|uniref:16S rRNA (guanine(527)-N(7))-methyltransferase RsmG n=1 Tax=Reyranella sp. CPCC 100927 TaxID=2599616 RepID=UPI0011B3A20E|nr:16S rRNA (guanine(527)-N(7))-methyltransferase RsmG [Reyranella sp. CPCC 100927]TWT14800.1 16S rRNA (guanine(527)-N(7))-methyltransferase RsmG [Reyranella sp. CPCC 100927]